MKISLIFVVCFFTISFLVSSQQPVDVYRKPLKEVLSDVERRYGIRLQYSENLIKGLDVNYATWRYRMDPEETLANILMPLDLIFQKTGDNTYQISNFTYYERLPRKVKSILINCLQLIKTCKSGNRAKLNSGNVFLNS